jgi:rhodanese-related sulfurtransferase
MDNSTITGQSTMQQVLEAFPGAQRALFRRYHIGGCSSCGFHPTETLEQLCNRNEKLNVQEVIGHIRTSHEQDQKILMSTQELKKLLDQKTKLKLLDVRSREEWEAVRLEGSSLLSQEVMQQMLSEPKDQLMVIYDHLGTRGLDAAAYFLGHGFQNVRCLKGGIDAWSQEVDSNVPRYKIES